MLDPVGLLAGNMLDQHPIEKAGERLVDLLRAGRALGHVGHDHAMPPHPEALAVELGADHQARDDQEEDPHPQRAPEDRPPRPLVREIEEEQGRRHLVGGRQRQEQPRPDVVSLPPGIEHRHDEEQDQEVIIAVVQVAEDRPEAQQQDERPEHRRQPAVARLGHPEAHDQGRGRHGHLEREPAHRAGDGREPHQADRA